MQDRALLEHGWSIATLVDPEPIELCAQGPQLPNTFLTRQVVQADGTYAVFSERVSSQDELRLIRLRDGPVRAAALGGSNSRSLPSRRNDYWRRFAERPTCPANRSGSGTLAGLGTI